MRLNVIMFINIMLRKYMNMKKVVISGKYINMKKKQQYWIAICLVKKYFC